ncbi:hypothetical protein HMPREF1066_04292 [Bacteroides fragilis CL03T00C08]|nr:hypothetical protein HMPREF1066_04292 [Bacteroides fragilis CL03T00C08]
MKVGKELVYNFMHKVTWRVLVVPVSLTIVILPD